MQGVKGTSSKVERTCQACGKTFLVFPSDIKGRNGRFCSVKCRYPSKVELTCETCGKVFYRFPFQVKNGKIRFCSRKCQGQALRGENHPMFGKHHSVEAQEKMGKGRLNYFKRVPIDERRRGSMTDEQKAKLRQSVLELWKDTEYKERVMKGICSEETRKSISEANKQNWQDPNYRKKMSQCFSQSRKQSWQDPEFVKKVMAARAVKPTKPEKRLIEICSKHFPQFEYNGDCSLGILLGSSTPDFVNTNGRKEVIEVFGDYYHSPELLGDRWQGSELGKIMVYNSLGWRCLVIWEHDLKEKSEGEIVNMVKAFTGRRIKCHR